MRKSVLAVCIIGTFAGCNNPPAEPLTGIDQCMRQELFKQCMQLLPAGPQATKYNDWDEVVSECDTTALRQSERLMKMIKAECRQQ